MHNPPTLEAFKAAVESGGLNSGLEYLNARVEHRFTAIYQLADGMMRNIAIYDKQREVVPGALLAVPLGDSFCQFTLADGKFLVGAGMDDARLKGHPYEGVVNSYVGLPLSRGGAELFGTLCHFDFVPLAISDDEFTYLTQVTRVLPEYLGA